MLKFSIIFCVLHSLSLLTTSTIKYQNHLNVRRNNSIPLPKEYPNVLRFIDTQSFDFKKSKYTKGALKRPELLCEGELCSKYQLELVKCDNLNYHEKPLPRWSCNFKDLNSAITIDDHFVECEHPKTIEENFVEETCSLLYSLKYIENNQDQGFLSNYLTLFIVFAIILLVAFMFIYLKRNGFL